MKIAEDGKKYLRIECDNAGGEVAAVLRAVALKHRWVELLIS